MFRNALIWPNRTDQDAHAANEAFRGDAGDLVIRIWGCVRLIADISLREVSGRDFYGTIRAIWVRVVSKRNHPIALWIQAVDYRLNRYVRCGLHGEKPRQRDG